MDAPETGENKPSVLTSMIEWARRERQKADFVRHNAGKLNIDATRFVAGQVMDIILYDDTNCFSERPLQAAFPPEQVLETQREAILERLAWESSSTEIPANIRNQLSQTRELIQNNPWADITAFRKASEGWYKMRQFVQDEFDRDDDLQADHIYFRVNLGLVDKEYTESGGT